MPVDYKDYHPKWKLISWLIRYKRAGNRCEECGLLNGQIIKRLKGGSYTTPGPQDWDMIHSAIRNGGHNMTTALKNFGFTKVVLTVAHVDQDKTNNRFDNLKAWCQRCHLKHDQQQHVQNRKYGRNHKKNNLKLEL